MEGNLLCTRDVIIFLPYQDARPVATGAEKPVQNRHEKDSFDRHCHAASSEQTLDHQRETQRVPESPKHESRSQATLLQARSGSFPVRLDHHYGLAELGARRQKPVQLPLFLQSIKPPEGGDHTLLASALLPAVFHNLQIDAIT